MGRAWSIILIASLIFLFPVAVHGEKTVDLSVSLDGFVEQYERLVYDGKEELAEELLYNRFADMENYMETRSMEEQFVWSTVLDRVNKRMSAEELKTIVKAFETLSSQKSGSDMDMMEELHSFADRASDLNIPAAVLTYEWEMHRPYYEEILGQESVSIITNSLSSMTGGSMSAREKLLAELNYIKAESPKEDGFMLAIGVVGGSILVTLTYVAIRKHPSRSKNRHNLRRQNS